MEWDLDSSLCTAVPRVRTELLVCGWTRMFAEGISEQRNKTIGLKGSLTEQKFSEGQSQQTHTGHLDSRLWGPRGEPEGGPAFNAPTKQRGRRGLTSGAASLHRGPMLGGCAIHDHHGWSLGSRAILCQVHFKHFQQDLPTDAFKLLKNAGCTSHKQNYPLHLSQALYDPSPTVTQETKNKTC